MKLQNIFDQIAAYVRALTENVELSCNSLRDNWLDHLTRFHTVMGDYAGVRDYETSVQSITADVDIAGYAMSDSAADDSKLICYSGQFTTDGAYGDLVAIHGVTLDSTDVPKLNTLNGTLYVVVPKMCSFTHTNGTTFTEIRGLSEAVTVKLVDGEIAKFLRTNAFTDLT
jgi:hypothetical protein